MTLSTFVAFVTSQPRAIFSGRFLTRGALGPVGRAPVVIIIIIVHFLTTSLSLPALFCSRMGRGQRLTFFMSWVVDSDSFSFFLPFPRDSHSSVFFRRFLVANCSWIGLVRPSVVRSTMFTLIIGALTHLYTKVCLFFCPSVC